jgi:L-alanine-DL-glutamate epimerase-like enolase superfamily enzyme
LVNHVGRDAHAVVIVNDGLPEVVETPLVQRLYRSIWHQAQLHRHGALAFWDYAAVESLPWWLAAVEAAEHGWPPPVRDRVPVNCTVPAVDPARAHAIASAPHGCRTAKVKVAEPGQTLADDVARVEAVRDALGPGGRVRVDANGGWDVDTAVPALRALDRAAGLIKRRV